jgi:hypothetical protein
MTKIYDLSDPTRPVFVRDFGLAGQEPGGTAAGAVPPGVHGPIVLGNRVYFAYGTSTDGMLQIVDRAKLLGGPKEPTAANLDAPEISRLYMSPNWGGHTAFPVLGVKIADWASNTKGQVRDFVVLVSEAIANECREFRQASFMIDITTETRPFSVATFQVPEAKGASAAGADVSARTRAASRSRRSSTARWSSSPTSTVGCARSTSAIPTPRARPVSTSRPPPSGPARALRRERGARSCKVAIQTNNVEADERGLIYLADRANTGLHIVRLIGEAAKIVGGK